MGKLLIPSCYAPFGTPTSRKGLCFKIWDTGKLRAPAGSQGPTQNCPGALPTPSGTEGLGRSHGVPSGRPGALELARWSPQPPGS